MPHACLRSAARPRSRGFTYLLLLFVLALGGIGLAALGERASLQVQRDKEAELRFRGQAIARAIASYWQATPGPVKQYPRSFDELLEDRRGLVPQRHLRQVYADPFTGRPDWVLVAAPPPAPTSGAQAGTSTTLAVAVGAVASGLGRDEQLHDLTRGPALHGFSAVHSRGHQRLLSTRDVSQTDPRKPARVSDLRFDAQALNLSVSRLPLAAGASATRPPVDQAPE